MEIRTAHKKDTYHIAQNVLVTRYPVRCKVDMHFKRGTPLHSLKNEAENAANRPVCVKPVRVCLFLKVPTRPRDLVRVSVDVVAAAAAELDLLCLEEGPGLTIVVLWVVVLRDVHGWTGPREQGAAVLLSDREQVLAQDAQVEIGGECLLLVQEVQLALLVEPHRTPHKPRIHAPRLGMWQAFSGVFRHPRTVFLVCHLAVTSNVVGVFPVQVDPPAMSGVEEAELLLITEHDALGEGFSQVNVLQRKLHTPSAHMTR